jgi:2-oxoglutarate ferredoxin oxidoreductase subunit gamma
MSRVELTIAGVGGQGSILAGVILGSAVVMYDDKYSALTQAYSSELRGGFAAAWVVVSDEVVVFPRVTQPDFLVAQAPDSIKRFAGKVRSSGTLIIDSDMISEVPDNIEHIYRVPATSLSRNQLKAPMTANIIMLGALCKVWDGVSRGALEKAIADAVPPGKDKLNLEAFQAGFESVTG